VAVAAGWLFFAGLALAAGSLAARWTRASPLRLRALGVGLAVAEIGALAAWVDALVADEPARQRLLLATTAAALATVDGCLARGLSTLPPGWDFAAPLAGSDGLAGTPDDGALVMHLRGRGLVILTGCGHAGLINTVREAVARTGVSRVHALVGGFHLCHASPRRIGATIRDLRPHAPRWVIPSHCSGLEFEAALGQAFPRGFALDSVGTATTGASEGGFDAGTDPAARRRPLRCQARARHRRPYAVLRRAGRPLRLCGRRSRRPRHRPRRPRVALYGTSSAVLLPTGTVWG